MKTWVKGSSSGDSSRILRNHRYVRIMYIMLNNEDTDNESIPPCPWFNGLGAQ